jgi:N-acetylmuramoyl-L-alanine amidase
VPQTASPKRVAEKALAAEKNNASGEVAITRKPSSGATAVVPAPIAQQREVTTEDSDMGLAQISALSDDPDQVKATHKPTSGPVVQNVTARESAKSNVSSQSASAEPAAPLTRRKTRNSKSANLANAHEAVPTAAGDLSLIRALGLKIGRIVVDAGHGGHDTGTIGPNGLLEKDLVLDVALRLGKLLENKLGADVIYTRQDDTFIPLETRTAIANQNEADLFISIHANSSSDASARGVETYYLNFNSSPDALEVAARENAVSEKSVHELGDLVKKIALKEKIDESREFAATVQKSLHAGEAAKSPGVHDRGVKKAPFIVLIGANMPSILTEISFVSNPTDERKLRTPEYRQRIAESLYRGVTRYAQGLSGVKVASAKAAIAGQ